jgi:putative ABC transport system permease protein
MSEIRIAWRNLLSRPVLSGVSVVILAMGIALAIAVLILAQTLEDGLVRAARPFDLLVGAKGSANQLVMSTILLQDAPLGNVPYSYFEKLSRDPRVASAIPVALGDNAFGVPIIGVDEKFFQLNDPQTGKPIFEIARGNMFQDKDHHEEHQSAEEERQAVIGARVADTFDLGTTVQSAHGTIGTSVTERHEIYYHVVGVLKPSGSPWDRAIFVPIDSYWDAHEKTSSEPAVTAAMIRPIGVKEFYQLHQEINQDSVAQAVLSGKGMQELFDRIDQGKSILTMVSYVTLLMGALTVVLVSYAVANQQRREAAILRALGASRGSVFGVGLSESLLIGSGGILLGVILGHIVAWVIAKQLEQASALALEPGFVTAEFFVGGAMLLLAVAAGLVPAMQLYRQDVVTHLAS